MTVDDIRKKLLNHWLSESEEDDPVYCGFSRCEKHNIFYLVLDVRYVIVSIRILGLKNFCLSGVSKTNQYLWRNEKEL